MTTITDHRVTISTPDLMPGDIVHVWGARVLLTGTPHTYRGYDSQQQLTFSWQEMPIISGEIFAYPWMTTWTVQGNELARWDVERGPLGRSVDMMGAACDASNAHDQACRLGCGLTGGYDQHPSLPRGVPCEEGRALYAAMREACNAWVEAMGLPESQ